MDDETKKEDRHGRNYQIQARLNAHGVQQEFGINYWETYASTIRLIITLAKVNRWYSRQLDFVLAYPQADIEGEIYMKLPKGF